MRGKHAATAAKRRAETAEAQLDRLMPKLVDAERVAKRYKSEAERVPVLSQQLNDLKDRVGIPAERHIAELRAVEAERDALLDAYDVALGTILDHFARLGLVTVNENTSYINDELTAALAVIPEAVTDSFLKSIGMQRDIRRALPTPRGIEAIHAGLYGKTSADGRLVEVDGDLAHRMAKYFSDRCEAKRSALEEIT